MSNEQDKIHELAATVAKLEQIAVDKEIAYMAVRTQRDAQIADLRQEVKAATLSIEKRDIRITELETALKEVQVKAIQLRPIETVAVFDDDRSRFIVHTIDALNLPEGE